MLKTEKQYFLFFLSYGSQIICKKCQNSPYTKKQDKGKNFPVHMGVVKV
jgi:hypothetical protein